MKKVKNKKVKSNYSYPIVRRIEFGPLIPSDFKTQFNMIAISNHNLDPKKKYKVILEEINEFTK